MRNTPPQNSYLCRTLDPRPGLFLTLVACGPYLSGSLEWFSRSAGHDVVLGAVLAFVWGSVFFWDGINRKWPPVTTAIRFIAGLSVLGFIVSLYVLILWLIFR